MTPSRAYALVIGAVICAAPPVRSQEQKVEWKLEIRVCAEASGMFVKGGGCWVTDLMKGKSTYEYQACIGVVVEGGVLVAGGQASVMLCGTLTVPVELAGNDKAWQQVAKDRLVQRLADPAMRQAIRKVIGKDFSSVEVRTPVRTADAATAKSNRDAINKSTKK